MSRVGNTHVVQVDEGDEAGALGRLNGHAHVRFVEFDGIGQPSLTPNDPSLGSQYYLTTIGAPAAWDVADGTGIKVAVCDTGVDGTHPDLVTKMLPGYNFFDNNTDSSDIFGHGTAVAGVVAAAANNAVGIAGVGYNAQIIPVRVCGPDGYANWSTVATAIRWAADQGAKVVNLSFTDPRTHKVMHVCGVTTWGKTGYKVVDYIAELERSGEKKTSA